MTKVTMSLPSEIDVAIIGAGAAGLGAARALENSALSMIVLEARDRVGGRGHTIIARGGITFDVGCGWLHSADRNSFAAIAEQLNFELDKVRPPWREQGFAALHAIWKKQAMAHLRNRRSTKSPRCSAPTSAGD
jgi:monoamine oxidase